jgi:hypothetical protein
LRNPTDIFIPLEKFYNQVYSLVYEKPSPLKFLSGSERLLLINGDELRIHWILDENINKIIVTNKDNLKVIQKNSGVAEKIVGLTSINIFKNNDNSRLMLYFGEKDNKNFSFIFRTVLSKPKLNQDSALIININS